MRLRIAKSKRIAKEGRCPPLFRISLSPPAGGGYICMRKMMGLAVAG